MFTKRTAIGTGIGTVIIGIGVYALISSIGLQTVQVDETFKPGETTTYSIRGPEHAHQTMKITGEKFNVELQSPADGLQVPNATHTNEITFDWVHLEDGNTRITLKNTGSSEMHVIGTFEVSTDPILFTYHIIVITAGVIIIGFSMGFSVRKPKGF